MYIDELKHFLFCIKNRQKPISNGYDAKKILEVVLAAKKSSKEKRMVKIV